MTLGFTFVTWQSTCIHANPKTFDSLLSSLWSLHIQGSGVLPGCILDGFADELWIEHGTQSKWVVNRAFLVFRLHLLIGAELRDLDPYHQRAAILM
jgi:hypothetical protein